MAGPGRGWTVRSSGFAAALEGAGDHAARRREPPRDHLGELSCFDEDGLEFFGAVDLAMLEWVGSASATHAYWHALSPDTVEIVLLAAAGSVVGFEALPDVWVDDVGQAANKSPGWWRRLKRAATKVRDRWKSRRIVRRPPRTPPPVRPPPVPQPMMRGPSNTRIPHEEWAGLCNRFQPVKDDAGNLIGHFDNFGNFLPAGGTHLPPGQCP